MSDTTEYRSAGLRRSEEPGLTRLTPTGDWWIESVATAEREAVAAARNPDRAVVIDLHQIGHVDTSGAFVLHRLAERLRNAGATVAWSGASRGVEMLLAAVADADTEAEATPRERGASLVVRGLSRIGRPVAEVGSDIVLWMSILGSVVRGVARGLVNPRRLRLTSIVHHLDRTAFQAVPIMLMMGFLIGIIIAQQGAFQFRDFVGARIVVVDLTAFLVLREIGVLLAAVMLAGRSGSAYTAEIGSMKMREEVDALTVIGLDPNEMLVMPRVIALVIALPLLVFLVDIAGLVGGALVCFLYLDMPFEVFINRLRLTGIETFAVGLIKAPFMALIVGIVAAAEGLKVQGSTESLGLRTTSSVVKAIFLVIVVDGFFAVFFAAIRF